jgi:parvulin-like peptidyl-prolyl isomerase
MTFRTRSAPRPTRRRMRRSDTRRAVYITILFSLAIVSSVALMGGVFAAGYYGDHGAPMASANGETISKDAVRDRAALNLARYQRQIADYQYLRNQGQITSDEANTLISTITTSEAQATIYSDALTQLIDEAELRQYASKNNINITDQMVDAQIQIDSTIPEMRHVKMIGIPTKATPPSSSVSNADSITALAKAQGYWQEIQGGKKWVDVDKEATTANDNTSGGDVGLITLDTIAVDPDLADATFALKKVDDVTAVFKGSDGAYRFATVTSIVPKFVDKDWQSTIGSTASADGYRAYARAEATQKAVKTAIEAKYIYGATTQRRVQEIAISAGLGQPGDGDEVKLKIMVMAPGHSTANASGIGPADPSWATAKTRADDAVAKVRKDPSQWAKMAADTTVNDDTIFNTAGGDIQYWLPTDIFNAQTAAGSNGLNMTTVAGAVFKDGIAPGTILDPIQEPAQGWVIVMFEGRRPAPAQRIANSLFAINGGADFAEQAKVVSEAADAPQGGDLGWVSQFMLTASQEQVVFYGTPVGRVSNIVSGNGYYLYKVVEEQLRTPDPDQQLKLKKVVFSRWLTQFQANALVWKDAAALTAMAPAAAATP